MESPLTAMGNQWEKRISAGRWGNGLRMLSFGRLWNGCAFGVLWSSFPLCGLDINLLNIRMSLLGNSLRWVVTVKKKGEFHLLCSRPYSQHFAGAGHGSPSINIYRTVEGVTVSQHTGRPAQTQRNDPPSVPRCQPDPGGWGPPERRGARSSYGKRAGAVTILLC